MRPGVRIAGHVRSVLSTVGPAAGQLPVARDFGVPRADPVAGRRCRHWRLDAAATAAAAATAPSVRLRRLRPGAPEPGDVSVRPHVLPAVRGPRLRRQQVVGVPRVRPAHTVPAARQRAGQVAGGKTVARAAPGVRTAGRGQSAVPAGQAPLGSAQVQPGVLYG